MISDLNNKPWSEVEEMLDALAGTQRANFQSAPRARLTMT